MRVVALLRVTALVRAAAALVVLERVVSVGGDAGTAAGAGAPTPASAGDFIEHKGFSQENQGIR